MNPKYSSKFVFVHNMEAFTFDDDGNEIICAPDDNGTIELKDIPKNDKIKRDLHLI